MVKNFFQKAWELIRSFFDVTFWKFVVVGLICTAIGTGLMYLLYDVFGVNYWISTASNQVLAAVLALFINTRFTFQIEKLTRRLVLLYIITLAVCFALGYGIARPLVSHLFSSLADVGQGNTAMLVGLIIYKILDYFGQRFFVFKKKLNRPGSAEEEAKDHADA